MGDCAGVILKMCIWSRNVNSVVDQMFSSIKLEIINLIRVKADGDDILIVRRFKRRVYSLTGLSTYFMYIIYVPGYVHVNPGL